MKLLKCRERKAKVVKRRLNGVNDMNMGQRKRSRLLTEVSCAQLFQRIAEKK